jgi:ATP-dependent DNA helicase RecG
MNLEDIYKIVADGESQTIEFKSSTANLKSALETVCAFLNTEGGVVFIGVNQHGKIIGQHVTDNTQQEIAKSIAKIEPFPSSVSIQYLSIKANQQLIMLVVKKGDKIPYSYDGRAFYRNQSSTMKMPQSRYSELLLERNIFSYHSWELQASHIHVDELEQDEIQRTTKIAVNTNRINAEVLSESIEDILMRLDLIQSNKITNAAAVLFANSVKSNFPQCAIKMSRFRGKNEIDGFIDNQTVYGNAFQLMEAANKFIMQHLPVASLFDKEKLERIDKPLLPVLAVREALSNAICHRDYAILNSAINLSIFDDRMEIWNPGMLPSVLSLDDLKKRHKSYPRNKNIAHVFYLRQYVETWGTGTTKMIKLCRDHDIPEPIFDEYSGGFSVTFKFEHTEVTEDIEKAQLLTERQKAILNIIKKEKVIKIDALLDQLSDPPSARMIRKDLNMLRTQGYIQLEGHGKSAQWTIKNHKNQ